MKKGNIVTYVKTFWYDKENKRKYDVYHKVRDYCHYTGKFSGMLITFVIYDIKYKERYL